MISIVSIVVFIQSIESTILRKDNVLDIVTNLNALEEDTHLFFSKVSLPKGYERGNQVLV